MLYLHRSCVHDRRTDKQKALDYYWRGKQAKAKAKAISEQEKAEGRRPNKQLLIFTQDIK